MSTAVATKIRYTPEDLLAMPDGKSYELVDGQLVERNIGFESSSVGGRLLIRLGSYCEEHGLGWTVPADAGYQCFPHDPNLVRKPDVSFVRFGRLPGGEAPKGWAKIRPDLAVEVVSPKDWIDELDEKLDDYRKVGVPLIWVIYLKSRSVMVHRDDGSANRLLESDELSGEGVIPGFRCPVRELFPRPEPLPETVEPTAIGPGQSREEVS